MFQWNHCSCILCIALSLKKTIFFLKITIAAIFSRGYKVSWYRLALGQSNHCLKCFTSNCYLIEFLEPTERWKLNDILMKKSPGLIIYIIWIIVFYSATTAIFRHCYKCKISQNIHCVIGSFQFRRWIWSYYYKAYYILTTLNYWLSVFTRYTFKYVTLDFCMCFK